MKLILTVFMLLGSLSASADCYWSLLSAQKVLDSSQFQIHISKVRPNENETMDEQTAINAAQFLAKKYCGEELVIGKVECAKPFANLPKICFVDIQGFGGYFLVTKNYVDHVQVNFNRWD
jgi:hypothetical protein